MSRKIYINPTVIDKLSCGEYLTDSDLDYIYKLSKITERVDDIIIIKYRYECEIVKAFTRCKSSILQKYRPQYEMLLTYFNKINIGGIFDMYDEFTSWQVALHYQLFSVLKYIKMRNTEVDVDQICILGSTAIYHAISYNIVDTVAWLLYNGANPNQIDSCGDSVLHWCIKTKMNKRIIELLLMYGAEIDITARELVGNKYDLDKLLDILTSAKIGDSICSI
jgi:hypothetical protein